MATHPTCPVHGPDHLRVESYTPGRVVSQSTDAPEAPGGTVVDEEPFAVVTCTLCGRTYRQRVPADWRPPGK